MDYDEYNDDLLAAIYDDDNPDGEDHDYYRALAERLKATHITDLGCGTGILTVTLAGPGRTVVGIDPAAAMLARAAARPSEDAVEWRLGTSTLIDVEANDLIIMTGNVAMHILGSDWQATLDNIARGLKSGGVLAFETRNPQAAGMGTVE
ncbi:class I SAM-dependent methyltransferase [Arthrobacter sp. TMN-50]